MMMPKSGSTLTQASLSNRFLKEVGNMPLGRSFFREAAFSSGGEEGATPSLPIIHTRFSQIILSSAIALCRRFLIPPNGSSPILCHAFAIVIAIAQIILRISIPLLSSKAIPFHRLGVRLAYAFAIGIAHAQIILRISIPLLSSKAIPFHLSLIHI